MPLTAEDFKKSLADLRTAYSAASNLNNFTALISGESKAGKTVLLGTGRFPVLVDMFDPRGELVLKPLIEQGKVFVRLYTDETSKNPKQYRNWETQWQKDIQSGYFNNFGTYCIDSATTFIQAAANEIIKRSAAKALGKGKAHSGDQLEIQDYTTLYNLIRDVVKMSSSQQCDFLMTAHLLLDKDETTGEILYDLNVFKTLKTELPLLFSEYYCMIKKAKPGGPEYKLLTNTQGRYRAGSRLASLGKIELEEEPNLKAILKKAGLSTEDKPF